MEPIVYQPIGIIRSPFEKLEGIPIQPAGAQGVRGFIDLDPELAEGLQDLEGFSHIVLIYHMHLAAGPSLSVKPFLDDESRGVFATRAPSRPNPIGLSVVLLEKIEGNRLHIDNVDIVDRTPLLDIKPFVPEFDPTADVRIGWLRGKVEGARSKRSDKRFK
jgi:tRNA-Thr(GGU) m(6)t(6)A37 methyltransferase TsaA